jgi:hypothetical protein
MRIILLLVSTFLLLVSCEVNTNTDAGTFQIILPDTSKTHRPNTLFDDLNNWSRQMALPRIDTGVSDFELRLWTGSMIDPDQMIVLRKSGTNVTARKFNYKVSFDSLKHFKQTDTYQNDSLSRFADSLQNVDFSKIISQEEIENFRDNIADGIIYFLEVATPKYYKLVTYHCPEHFAKAEPNNKKFLDLVLALDRHLHFYSPICAF